VCISGDVEERARVDAFDVELQWRRFFVLAKSRDNAWRRSYARDVRSRVERLAHLRAAELSFLGQRPDNGEFDL
jgi:hypothetical protein